MNLFTNPASPYARKVVATAIETGQGDRIEQINVAVAPSVVNADLAASNPLMKIPTLVTDRGEALFDSRVICEYLDSLHNGPKLIPASGPERWRVLRLQALADGILDAGLLVRYELALRPAERQWKDWIDGQTAKVAQGLDLLERESEILSMPLNVGHLAVAGALGWLEFRKPTGDNRARRPKIFAWYDSFQERPSMKATVPRAL